MAKESSSTYLFFIVKYAQPDQMFFSPGTICYVRETTYFSQLKCTENIKRLELRAMGGYLPHHIKVDAVQQLTMKEAELLQAVTEQERLSNLKARKDLDFALGLTKDSPVDVEINGEWCEGVIRYIGGITEPNYSEPITGTFFGIELKGKYQGKGQNEGAYRSKNYFTCGWRSGIFAPFTRLRARPQKLSELPSPSRAPLESVQKQLVPGDRVTFFTDDDQGCHGTVIDLKTKDDGTHVVIKTDVCENGGDRGPVILPIECVIRKELLALADRNAALTSDAHMSSSMDGEAAGLSINSMVQLQLGEGKAYGTVRWIGSLPGLPGPRAGLELEEEQGVSDGTFRNKRYFSCPAKKGLFVKLTSCQPDTRFLSADREGAMLSNKRADVNGECDRPVVGNVGPLGTEEVQRMLIGDMKGIQGHCNSCYMDSALFSLFACSSVLDSLLFKSTKPGDLPVQTILRQDIVNPLRSKGFVGEKSVMKLRRMLQTSGHCPTFTTDEKDPEEFLTLIMSHILHLEPLLKLSTGTKVQESYYYQIFLDQNHSLVLPTLQQLLEHSFHSNLLRLAEVPSCLILQMPRFGKKFKMFDKIIPSLELDISALLLDNPQECVLCGELASVECNECFRDPVFGNAGFKQFCRTCSEQVHRHRRRKSHSHTQLSLPVGYHQLQAIPKEKLQLFAVLCIETSHYVSFVRHGPDPGDWVFFDSMADRQGDQDGFNIPRVQACPEVARYLKMPLGELAVQNPREMEGVAKRLFCDAYMYLYQSPTMALYH